MQKYHISFTAQDRANIPNWRTAIAGVLYKGEDVFMCFPIGADWDEKDAKSFAKHVAELLNGDDKPIKDLIALRAIAEHVLSVADDAYLAGHPEFNAIVDECKAALGKVKP